MRNSAAVNLAKGRYYRLRFLLPDDGDQYLAQIIEQVRATQDIARQDLTIIDCVQIDMRDPHLIARYLIGLEPSELDGLAIMAPTSPQVRDATTRLNGRGIRTVQFLAGQKDHSAQDFMGTDNLAVARTAARIVASFRRGNAGLVLVIAETMRSLASIERRLGFDEVPGGTFSRTERPSLTGNPGGKWTAWTKSSAISWRSETIWWLFMRWVRRRAWQ